MFVMGLDIGYSNLKLAMGVSGSPPEVSLLPAGAAPVDRLPESLGRSDDVLRVTVGDSLWATGVNPGRFSLWNRALHQDYARSDSYRALFHAALLLSGRDTVDLVVTGLPVSQWLDRDRRDEIAQRLTGRHRVTPKREVRVIEVKVIPQPIGGYLDVLWSGTNGVVLEEGRVLVIDPGFFSVDWVVIEAGDLRKTSSGTSLEAMSVLLDHASRLIADEHGGKVSVDRLEEALRTGRGQVLLFGQAIEIGPYIRQAAAKVALVESARVSGSSAAPWPWALNHSGRTFYPGSPQAAIDQIRGAWSAGMRAIDVGLMQVNLRWHRHRVRRPEDLIDPLTNLQVGADILAEAIGSSPGDLALGVGRYHAWQDRAAAYRYGRKVLALADRIRNARIQ